MPAPRLSTNGYLYVYEPEHPLAHKDGYVAEHRRLVWDAGLLHDRRLQVHHLNGDRTDNRLENLEVVTIQEHPLRHEPRGWAGENKAKTHCKYGHEFSPENTYRYGPSRACRACAIARARAWKLSRRAERPVCSARIGAR